jgi:hypothetical protein
MATKTKTDDPLWICVESHHKGRANGEPVFVQEGSRWRASSGVPAPGSSLWAPADSSDSEIADKKWERLRELEQQAASRNKRETPATPRPRQVKAIRTFEDYLGYVIREGDLFNSNHPTVQRTPEAFVDA